MFFVLKHKDYHGRNPIKKVWYTLFPLLIKDDFVKNDLAHYGIFTLHTVDGRVNVQKVNRKLKAWKSRLLLPDTLKGRGIDGFSSDGFVKTALFNTASYILSKVDDKRALTVCVVDRNGQYAHRAGELFRCAGSVAVFTEQPQKYRLLSDEMRSRFGADFVVRDREQTSADLDFIISPDEIPPCMYIKNERFELDEKVLRIASGFSRLLPEGISEADFAAAIALFERQSRFTNLKSETLRCGNSTVFVNDFCPEKPQAR